MSERVAIVAGAGGELGRATAEKLLHTAATRQFVPADALAHAVTPEAIADVIVYLASDAAAPVSGAVVPAYGA